MAQRTGARTQTYEAFLKGELGKKPERVFDPTRRSNDIWNRVYQTQMQSAGGQIPDSADPMSIQALTNLQRAANSSSRAGMGQVPGGRINPVPGAQLSNSFGAPRSGGRSHQGIDIFAPQGTPVVATTSGTARGGYENKLGGTSFGFTDDSGNYHYYTHLSKFAPIGSGARVAPGDVLGWVGNTGNARGTPSHLHYSINEGRQSVINSYDWLTGRI